MWWILEVHENLLAFISASAKRKSLIGSRLPHLAQRLLRQWLVIWCVYFFFEIRLAADRQGRRRLADDLFHFWTQVPEQVIAFSTDNSIFGKVRSPLIVVWKSHTTSSHLSCKWLFFWVISSNSHPGLEVAHDAGQSDCSTLRWTATHLLVPRDEVVKSMDRVFPMFGATPKLGFARPHLNMSVNVRWASHSSSHRIIHPVFSTFTMSYTHTPIPAGTATVRGSPSFGHDADEML